MTGFLCIMRTLIIRSNKMSLKNKGKIVLFVVLVSLMYLVSCSPGIPDSNKAYYEMSTSEFENYAPAKEKVEWGKMDFYLLNAAIFHKTNKIREENGKTTLQYSKALETSAYGHSMDMVKQEFFDHNNPNTGKTPFDRMADCGVNSGSRAENIAAFTFRDGSTYLEIAHTFVYQMWWNSPGHKKNMLGDFKYLGAGFYAGETTNLFPNQSGKFKTMVATQNFGTVVPD